MAASNSLERGFNGFELGHPGGVRGTSSFNATLADGTARSGSYYLKSKSGAGTANTATVLDLVGTFGSSLLDGESAKGMLRVWVRLNAYPSANGIGLCGFNASSSDNFPGCAALNTDGTFHAKAGSTASASSATVLALGAWYCFEVTSIVTNPLGGNDTTDVTVSVYSEDGTLLETKTVTRSSAPFGTSFSRPSLGNGTATAASNDADFDDAEWCVGDGTQAANVALTANRLNRVHPVMVTGQGASAAWTNGWQGVAEAPLDRSNTTAIATANNEQTVTTNGASTTFTHKTAAQLGLADIQGVKVYAYMKASGGAGNDALLIGGVETTVALNASYETSGQCQKATAFSALTDSAFDALEFGARNKRGVSIQLGCIMMEALHGGDGPAELERPLSWQHKIVTWTGNDALRDITGIGFVPDFVLVKKIADAPSYGGAMWVRQMGGTYSRIINEAPSVTSEATQAIKGVHADGFTLGPHAAVNKNGHAYVALCVADGGQHASGYFMHTGVMVGNAVDARSVVVETGWQPTAVMMLGTSMNYRDDGYSGDSSWQGGTNVAVADIIQGFNANGFEVGLTEVNADKLMYPWIAIREGSPISEYFAHGSLLNPGIPYTLTGMAFEPALVVGGRTGSSLHRFRGPAAVHSGTNSSPWFGGALGSNGFTALTSDGWTGGSDIVALASTTRWFAFSADGLVFVPTGEVEFESGNDGLTIGLSWREFYHTDATHLGATVDLNDPPDYYGGYKAPVIKAWGAVTRALSDSQGEYEASEVNWLESDVARQIRGWLGSVALKHVLNKQVIIRMIDDASRRLLYTPRTIFRGIVRGFKPRGGLLWEWRAQDFLSSLFGSANLQKQIPQEAISRDQFPSCPTDAIGKPVPIVFGEVSDDVSGTNAPAITGTPSRGAFAWTATDWKAGFGDLTSSAARPTGLGLSLAAGAAPSAPSGLSATVVGTPGSRTVRYAVSAANASGESAKTSDVVVSNAPDVMNGSNYVQLSWTAGGGATAHVVYGRNETDTYLDYMTSGETSYRDDGDDIEKGGSPVVAGISADVPNGTYGVIVTAVDAGGNESDPDAFYWDASAQPGSFADAGTVQTCAPNGSQKIQASWSAAAGAAKYRVYLGWYYNKAEWTQMIEVTAPTTSCEFTANPPWQTPVTTSNITPGANLITFDQRVAYAVSAILPDGITALSAGVAYGRSNPYRREVRVEWQAVTGATGYYVYRKMQGGDGTWDRRWLVASGANSFDDDFLDTGVEYIDGAPAPSGAVPVTYVGLENDTNGSPWHSFLVCGHQVESIAAVFQGKAKIGDDKFGVTFLAPGKTGYSTFFPTHTGTPQFKTVNSRRYTMIYARGPEGDAAADGSQALTINVRGRLDGDDGAMIEQLADIYKDFVVNFGFQDSGGTHLTVPTWGADLGGGDPKPQVDEDSFAALLALHARRLDGGYPGGIVFGAEGEFVALRDSIARLNQSCDCDSGMNRNSQFFVSGIDDTTAVLDAAREYTQLHDIVKETFDVEAQSERIENTIVYSYKRRYAKVTGKPDWDANALEVSDDDAIEALGEERKSRNLLLWGVRSGTVATDISNRRLLYYKDPPNQVEVLTNLRGLSTELGDVIKVTHVEGLSSSGWTNRPLRVVRHVTDPQKYTVKLVAVDVERLYAGTFILGDETLLAADWGSAGAADRLYGYLCSEATGLFGDGSTGKRVR